MRMLFLRMPRARARARETQKSSGGHAGGTRARGGRGSARRLCQRAGSAGDDEVYDDDVWGSRELQGTSVIVSSREEGGRDAQA